LGDRWPREAPVFRQNLRFPDLGDSRTDRQNETLDDWRSRDWVVTSRGATKGSSAKERTGSATPDAGSSSQAPKKYESPEIVVYGGMGQFEIRSKSAGAVGSRFALSNDKSASENCAAEETVSESDGSTTDWRSPFSLESS
jgi:hypothetical protein